MSETVEQPAKHETWWAPAHLKGMSCCCKHPDAVECAHARNPVGSEEYFRVMAAFHRDQADRCECCRHDGEQDNEEDY